MEQDKYQTHQISQPIASSLLEPIINSSPFGQLLIDQNGIIRLINNKIVELFGYSEAELIGKPLTPLIPERYRTRHFDLMKSYISQPVSREMGAGRDLTGLHKNGEEFPIEIGLSTVNTQDGQFVTASIVDITVRKRLERSLNQALANLNEFTNVVSHDLRSPLRGISDLITWIEEDSQSGDKDAVFKNLDRVKIRIDRMEKLVDNLLSYARAGKKSGEAQAVNLRSLIDNVILLVPAPDNVEIQLDIQLDAIESFGTPLETVIRNLYANAIKHNDSPTPQIVISTKPAGNYCLISVKDNGPGIPQIAKERVFQLFQTLSENRDANTGIGLAMVKRLVESHGGIVELDVTDGERGAAFNVWWPQFSRSDLNE